MALKQVAISRKFNIDIVLQWQIIRMKIGGVVWLEIEKDNFLPLTLLLAILDNLDFLVLTFLRSKSALEIIFEAIVYQGESVIFQISADEKRYGLLYYGGNKCIKYIHGVIHLQQDYREET